jgi:cytochrome P450
MLAHLLIPIIEARRVEPRDDLISVLVAAEIKGENGEAHRLTDNEVLAFAFLLLAAGSGTTWKQMGITLNALLRHPEALAAVRENRSFLRNIIEEAVRWQPTDPVFARFAAEDCELAGKRVPAGAVVHICLAAANRDPARWDRPDEFDPFRPQRTHLGFGTGPHTCLGAHVARLEMNQGIGALLDRLPGLRVDPDAPEPRVIGLYERGPEAVPVRFDGVE